MTETLGDLAHEDNLADWDGEQTPEEVAVDEIDAEAISLAFKTKKFALQGLLEKAASVVPTRDILPVLKNFLVEVEPGHLHVTATDLVQAVAASSEMVTVQQPGTCVLPAKRLLEIVKEAEEGDLTLAVKGDTAKIQVGPTTWDIKIMSGDDYPDLPTLDEIEFHPVDRAKFLQALQHVRYAAATDTHRASLMMIDVQDNKMRASDGVRFQQVDISFPLDVQIPVSAVDDLVKILRTTEATTIEVGEDDDSLMFRIAGDVFIAQKLNAIFPDMDSELMKPALANDQDLHVDRQELISAIKRVRITADPETSAVALTLTKDKVLVSAKDKYGSESWEQLDAKWDEKEKRVTFNHQHLIDMLTMADVKSCHFRLGEDTKTRPAPIVLRDAETGLLGILNQLRSDFLS